MIFSKAYKVIMFDWDDTIWDFRKNARESLLSLYKLENINKYYPRFETFQTIFEQKNQELWSLYSKGQITKEFLIEERFSYPLRLVGEDDINLSHRYNKEYLNIMIEQTELNADAKKTVEYLKQKGYKLAVISNGFVEVQYKKIDKSGIADFFDYIILSDEAGYNKPDIRYFQYALQKTKSTAQQCIVIGDNYQTDIIGAINAGIDAIFYNPNSNPVSIPDNTSVSLTSINRLSELIDLF